MLAPPTLLLLTPPLPLKQLAIKLLQLQLVQGPLALSIPWAAPFSTPWLGQLSSGLLRS